VRYVSENMYRHDILIGSREVAVLQAPGFANFYIWTMQKLYLILEGARKGSLSVTQVIY
jgi:hypothetical protein